ncbi:hypothetical protein L484_027570 [Morus notabilis]|uniref:Sodium channel modifier 1 n=1 Tax=Morus notabilis TaxID=981085 RepID=W9RYF1_9ROSA|nr:sodium channel modifier 1 [Morus notabilis]EXC17378.1 hypothetical protein L484_027570 [Morus notabilis]
MSVFGGDSWGRVAQHRKRRLEFLVAESVDASSYKKLSNGKYACLVCPQNPVIDSLFMLSAHCKGSRHRTAESRLNEREFDRQEELNKRIFLLGSIGGNANPNSATCSKKFKSPDYKPVSGEALKSAWEILSNKAPMQDSRNKTGDKELSASPATDRTTNCQLSVVGSSFPAAEASEEEVAKRFMDYRERRERELKFTAAGWKRNCHGKWYKDENVEFDSDEADPNVCLF